MSHSYLMRVLDELSGDGQLESQGEFTSDPAEAWRKMGAFQMPFRGAWILKLAQAAHKARCLLDVRQSRRKTEFLYQGWSVSRGELRSMLISPGEGDDSGALDHFGVGLRTLAQMEELPFVIEYPDGTADIWDGLNFLPAPRDEPAGQTGLRLTISHHRFGENTTFSTFLGRGPIERRAMVARILVARCCWRETPIRLDGRTLSDYLLDPHFGAGSLHRPLLLLHAEECPSQPSLRLAPSAQVSHLGGATAAKVDLGRSPCLAAGLVSVFLRAGKGFLDFSIRPGKCSSVLCWIRDGVEVAAETLPIPAGPVAVKIVCSAKGLKTDLSGLTLRTCPDLETRRKRALKAITDRLREAYEANLPVDVRARSGGSVSGLLGVGMLLALEPIVGLCMLGLYGIGEGDKRKLELETTLAVERGLKALLLSLEEMIQARATGLALALGPACTVRPEGEE